MKRLTVRLRAQAHQDIKDIFDWIVSETNYPSVAENLVNRIYARCETLGDFPLKGRARNDLQEGLRILAFERKAAIAYRVLLDADHPVTGVLIPCRFTWKRSNACSWSIPPGASQVRSARSALKSCHRHDFPVLCTVAPHPIPNSAVNHPSANGTSS